MANPFTSSTAPLAMVAPDLQTQQTQIMRQQQLADMLKQQALSPMGDTQMVSGWAVQKSPWEGLAKLGQAYFGNKLQEQTDEKNAALAQALQQRKVDAFNNMWGANQPSNVQGRDIPTALNLETGGGNIPQAQPQQVHPLYEPALRAAMAGDDETARKLYLNAFEQTPEMKNMAFKGIDPRLAGQLEIAAQRKAGMMEMQPGTTTLDLATGQERFQPTLAPGINYQNGVASAVPGFANAQAQIQGAQTGAQEAAKAGYDMITVDTPQGKVMMPRSQAVQMAQPQATPANMRVTPQQQASRDQMAVQTKQGEIAQLQQALQTARTPQEKADINKAIAAVQREISRYPQQQQGIAGIPLQSESSKTYQGERVKAFAKEAEGYNDAQKSSRSQLTNLDRLEQLYADPNVAKGALADRVSGLKNLATSFGVDIKGKSSEDAIKAITNEMVLKLRSGGGESMMPGAMSDADRKFLEGMAPQLAQSPEGRKQIISTMRAINQRNVEIADMARKYEMQNGQLDNGFRQQVAQYADKNPIFAKQAHPKPAAKPAQTTFDTLPNPAQYNGKRMRAPDGSIIRSNGKQWVKEQ